jgi:pectate lyase
VNPSGPVEAARVASQLAQQARVRIRIGSNTTIVGLDRNATIRGAWFDIRGTANVANSRSNIIIRNLTFQDTHDCFPQWSPTDGALGSWNALYDAIALRDTNNVWVDHNTFEDRDTADATLPQHFGVLFQVHDGLLDITNASDLVTVSWNRFRNHDKTMLIGSSDSAAADRGKLRVTFHHNLFAGISQRAPRVRFGQVHLYNNFYDVRATPNYGYSWGVGVESAIFAEENFFLTERSFAVDQIIERFNGTALSVSGTLVVGPRLRNPVDLIAAWNAVNDPDLGFDAGWTPTLNFELLPAWTTPLLVPLLAGPHHW